jgi:hypothetical protein
VDQNNNGTATVMGTTFNVVSLSPVDQNNNGTATVMGITFNVVPQPDCSNRSAEKSRHLESRPKAEARLDLEVAAGWAIPPSRGLWGGDALLPALLKT